MPSNRKIFTVLGFIVAYGFIFWGIGIGQILMHSSMWGLFIGLIIGLILSLIGVRFAEPIMMRVARAKPLKPGKYPELHEAFKECSAKFHMPLPEFYVTPELLPNFLVFGNSIERLRFIFTRGFLDEGRPEYIQAAIAWSVIALKRGSLQERTLGSALAYIFMFPAKIADIFSRGFESRYNILNLIFLLPLAPIASLFVHLAVGSTREIYEIDAQTTELTGDQGYLGVTLIEINKKIGNFVIDTDLTLVPLYITPPTCSNFYYQLFRTFPPLSKRINRLAKQREQARKEMNSKIQGETLSPRRQ